MTLSVAKIEELAESLDRARLIGVPFPPLATLYPDLSLDDAYAVQEAWTARQRTQGRTPCGFKLGLTTPAAQGALGIDRPIHGPLFAETRVASGALFPTAGLLGPRIEPELAFVMKESLSGDIDAEEALAAIGKAAPALEIIDNRIAQLDPATGARRNALDIVADGGGGCAFVMGEYRFDPAAADLRLIEVDFAAGDSREKASFATVFGNPVNALVELSRALADRGKRIEPGDVVLTGSPLSPVAISAGQRVTADFGELGVITLEIT